MARRLALARLEDLGVEEDNGHTGTPATQPVRDLLIDKVEPRGLVMQGFSGGASGGRQDPVSWSNATRSDRTTRGGMRIHAEGDLAPRFKRRGRTLPSGESRQVISLGCQLRRSRTTGLQHTSSERNEDTEFHPVDLD